MKITTMNDLYEHFDSEDSFRMLNRRIYKDTACGASISVYGTVDGKEVQYHNGYHDPLPANFVLEAFTIQTIVEGSDASVDSSKFVAGTATADDINAWIEEMEAEADRLRLEANNEVEPE